MLSVADVTGFIIVEGHRNVGSGTIARSASGAMSHKSNGIGAWPERTIERVRGTGRLHTPQPEYLRIHLVDGTYELFRSYFAAPEATAVDGSEVGATRAILRSLLSQLREDGVFHVACAFDHVIESFRNELFDRYKTGGRGTRRPDGPVPAC